MAIIAQHRVTGAKDRFQLIKEVIHHIVNRIIAELLMKGLDVMQGEDDRAERCRRDVEQRR